MVLDCCCRGGFPADVLLRCGVGLCDEPALPRHQLCLGRCGLEANARSDLKPWLEGGGSLYDPPAHEVAAGREFSENRVIALAEADWRVCDNLSRERVAHVKSAACLALPEIDLGARVSGATWPWTARAFAYLVADCCVFEKHDGEPVSGVACPRHCRVPGGLPRWQMPRLRAESRDGPRGDDVFFGGSEQLFDCCRFEHVFDQKCAEPVAWPRDCPALSAAWHWREQLICKLDHVKPSAVPVAGWFRAVRLG